MIAAIYRYRIWFAAHPHRLTLSVAWLAGLIWIPALIGFAFGLWFGLLALVMICAISALAVGRVGLPMWVPSNADTSIEIYNPSPPADSIGASGCDGGS